MNPRPTAAALLGNQLKIKILGFLQAYLLNPKLGIMGPTNLYCNNPSRDCDIHQSLRTSAPRLCPTIIKYSFAGGPYRVHVEFGGSSCQGRLEM